MKVTTFLSVNNENLVYILVCIVYKGVKVAPKQGCQNMFKLYYSLAINPRYELTLLEICTRNG